MPRRYTRKQLRQADEFVTFWHRVYQSLRHHQQRIIVGILAAIVAYVGSYLFAHYTERSRAETSHELARAMKMYAADLLTDDDAAKRMMQVDEDIPRFKSVEERRKATLAELDTLIALHKQSPAAEEAELVRAGVLYDAGRYDESLAAYGQFLAETDTEHRLRFLAREGRGYAFEAKGQLDAAMDEFKKLEAESDVYKDRAQFHQARILEKKGDGAGAQKMYASILEKHPATALREDISNRLAALENEHPGPK